MTVCLVQQLFRQKIGLSIDPHLVSSLIWPLLFQERHIPIHILQDIHLVRQGDPNGEAEDRRSAIIGVRARYARAQDIRRFTGIALQDPLDTQSALRNLCLIKIVNKFRSIKYPIIQMGQGNRDYVEYNREHDAHWSPYMDTSILLEERTETKILEAYRRYQISVFGIVADMPPAEWINHVKEERIVDNDNINSYIGSIIRNKCILKWLVNGIRFYGDEPVCSLSFTCAR